MIVLDDQALAALRRSNGHNIPIPREDDRHSGRVELQSPTYRIVPLSIFWANGNST